MTKRIPADFWATELHRFTSRNAGRATTIETGTLDFGTRAQQPGGTLRGITYDANGDRVLITLGERSGANRYQTHMIPAATAIFVLVDMKGRDEALAIRQKDTNTLLRFTDL